MFLLQPNTKFWQLIKVNFILLLFFTSIPSFSQSKAIDRNLFFLDDNVVEVTLTTDIKKLRRAKEEPTWQPAKIQMKFSDTLVINEQISVQTRGVYRKTYCDIASLMLNFKSPQSPRLSKLKKLKLVGGCNSGRGDEVLLLKEYLVYKLYNQLSIMSFRVRLLHVTYADSQSKMKPYSQYAFLIEDMDDVAERNNCIEKNHTVVKSEATNRQQITFVSIFQYMIGNTDFSIPNRHNVKLMVPKNDTLQLPYVIPYDFDYAGIVNAPYAVPREELGISSVRERLYRGYGRSIEEVKPLVENFKEKEESLFYTIKNFEFLKSQSRDDMLNYIKQFYDIISSNRMVKQVFVDNVRRF